jgi:choline dehydrogenase
MTLQQTYDFIVVGAGSAGAAAAARLSQDGQHSVLLLEAGPLDTNIWTRLPMGVAKVLSQGKLLRHYFTEPDPQMKNRKIYWPRGWVVGGSSTVNGMIWVHGTPREYDLWAQVGCAGWDYASLLPWFKKIEAYASGDARYRGVDGPVSVTEFQPVDALPDAFLDSVAAAGVAPRVKDYNAHGFGGSYLQFNTRNGVRCNTRMAYLDPAAGRPNLTLVTDALVSRITLKDKRAQGVQAQVAGVEVSFQARREVILCGGTFNSAQLLELSGIGNPSVLAAAGVPVLHALPGVGENLSEHVYSPVVYRTKPGVSWNKSLSSVAGQLRLGARWLRHRDGPLSATSITAQAFVPMQPQGKDAELKIQIQQASTAGNRGAGKIELDAFDGVTVASFQIRPRSRGHSHIQNANPSADPVMVSNHFTHSEDIEACLKALKLSRQIAQSGPMASWLQEELRPGPAQSSDEALVDYLRATGATAYHPVGTCRIGTDPQTSVVDAQLRVHGIVGLRVADGSVMPTIASTNTNAICIVIGERVADFILRDLA